MSSDTPWWPSDETKSVDLPTRILVRHLTLRRMRQGALALFAGDELLAGLMQVAIADDGERSILSAQFNVADILFDTEKPNVDTLN